jgi:hypothetical protein
MSVVEALISVIRKFIQTAVENMFWPKTVPFLYGYVFNRHLFHLKVLLLY